MLSNWAIESILADGSITQSLSDSMVKAGDEIRTRDLLLGRQTLYHSATPAQAQL